MRLIQLTDPSGQSTIGVVEGDEVRLLEEQSNIYELAKFASKHGLSMKDAANRFSSAKRVGYAQIEKDIQLPLSHPDPYHVWVTGTGLTHLGSAASRNAMHAKTSTENLTDSMLMFRMGLENGKMTENKPASQPEWFYKGNGLSLVKPGGDLNSPSFAIDGGEEPEIAGLYIIDQNGQPFRVGFALGNEFSDHAMERINYLYLAHSKLRPSSFGPEILIDELPSDIKGTSCIIRNNEIIWQKEFLTGEENMSHNFLNLEYHHFKYEMFCQPGDVHVHYFGTAALSYLDGIKTKDGDVFEISSRIFGHPLRNRLTQSTSQP